MVLNNYSGILYLYKSSQKSSIISSHTTKQREIYKLAEHSESANPHHCYVNFLMLCSPGGSTIFSRGLPYLTTIKNSSTLSWIEMEIRISTKI